MATMGPMALVIIAVAIHRISQVVRGAEESITSTSNTIIPETAACSRR
jgi:hypothetical protein